MPVRRVLGRTTERLQVSGAIRRGRGGRVAMSASVVIRGLDPVRGPVLVLQAVSTASTRVLWQTNGWRRVA